MRRDAERESRLTAAALQNHAIRRVVGGFGTVTLGEWVLGTTVAVHAYRAGGALAVGFVGFRFAPAAVAGLWTTQLADHARHRRVLAMTGAARVVATLLAAAALLAGLPFAVIVALVWLDAAAGSGYRPAQAALLPTLARSPGELTAATALVSNVKTSGQMIGALLGGVLIVGLPIAASVGCAAALYGVCVALTFDQRRFEHVPAPLIGLSGLRTGVRRLRREPDARVIVVYACLRSLARGLWLALAVVVSVRLLSLGRSGFGVLMAAAAVGALLALLLTPALIGNRRMGGWFGLGLTLCGVPVAVVSIFDQSVPAVALMVVWGVGMSLSDVGAQTLLNRIIPAEAIGPVTGVSESSKLLFEGMGSLLAPALLLAVSTRGAVLVAGASLPALVGLGYRRLARIDETAIARVDVLELLQGIPFFAPLRVDALEGVAARLHVDRQPAGTEIVRQGDLDARSWFLVGDGELVVEVDGYLVGQLRRGSQFGERGLLRGVARSATVRALTDVLLYRLEREDFLSAVAGVDLVEPSRTGQARAQQLDPQAALALAPLVQALGPAALAGLVHRSRTHEVAAETSIVEAGDSDDRYLVLLSGRAEVLVDGEVRRELLPGDAFGEIAVLHRVPRTASVLARAASVVLSVDGEAVRAAVSDHGGGELAALTAS
jgi:CRP-like cAMP-binding protein